MSWEELNEYKYSNEYFEECCGDCIFFPGTIPTDIETECPHKDDFFEGRMFEETLWRNIPCDKFFS